MRLIDADAFVKYMEEKCDPKSQLDPIILAIVIGALNEQPTAYDADRVVEELEIERKTANNTYNSFNMDVDLGRVFGLDKAIEIVKQSGVADDVCEWKKRIKTYDWEPSCEPNSTYNVAGVGWFKYCPYCGKKIKVVD